MQETATEQETEIKTEGGESTDVQTAAEVEEGAEPPRKWVSDVVLYVCDGNTTWHPCNKMFTR